MVLAQAFLLVFGLWFLAFVRDSILNSYDSFTFQAELETKDQKPKTKDQVDQCPRVINNPISSTVATFGSTSPTMRPS